jgi:hypothetical protein
MSKLEIFRAGIFHTPRNPFFESHGSGMARPFYPPRRDAICRLGLCRQTLHGVPKAAGRSWHHHRPAEALAIDAETGDFSQRKAADFVYLKPAPESALAAAIERSEDAARVLAAIFTLAQSDSIADVRVAGSSVHSKIA